MQLYFFDNSSFEDTPLYIWDEWVAYYYGAKVAIAELQTNQAPRVDPTFDGSIDGLGEFIGYGVAVAVAGESDVEHDEQFKEFLKLFIVRSVDLINQAQSYQRFDLDNSRRYIQALANPQEPKAQKMVQMLDQWYGAGWSRSVFRLD